MAWGGDEAWRHIRPVYRSSWILSRPPPDRKLWDSDFDPDVPIRVYISRSLRFGSMNVPERGRFSISILLSLSLSLSCTPFASEMLANVAFHRIPLDRGTQSNYAVKCRNKPIAGKGETQSKSNQWIDDHAYVRHRYGQSTVFCPNSIITFLYL